MKYTDFQFTRLLVTDGRCPSLGAASLGEVVDFERGLPVIRWYYPAALAQLGDTRTDDVHFLRRNWWQYGDALYRPGAYHLTPKEFLTDQEDGYTSLVACTKEYAGADRMQTTINIHPVSFHTLFLNPGQTHRRVS